MSVLARLPLCIAVVLALSTHAATACEIAIDVGHSSLRPGATSARGQPEFAFNLLLARDLAEQIRQQGCTVRMIGDGGDIIRLQDRTEQARGADLLLSVHHDSVQPHYLQRWRVDGSIQNYSDRFAGHSLFVSRQNPDPKASLLCATAIGASLIAEGFVPSQHHAEAIEGENKPFADEARGVHYFDNLVVLASASQPAVLIEAGVIVHRQEELLLLDPERRQRMASAIAEALVAGCPTGRPRTPPS